MILQFRHGTLEVHRYVLQTLPQTGFKLSHVEEPNFDVVLQGSGTQRPTRLHAWCASPLLHADLSRLPPVFVLTAGYGPLRDEALMYSQRLSEAGSRATHICSEPQIHGFILMGRVLDEANTAVSLCAAELRRALG